MSQRHRTECELMPLDVPTVPIDKLSADQESARASSVQQWRQSGRQGLEPDPRHIQTRHWLLAGGSFEMHCGVIQRDNVTPQRRSTLQLHLRDKPAVAM